MYRATSLRGSSWCTQNFFPKAVKRAASEYEIISMYNLRKFSKCQIMRPNGLIIWQKPHNLAKNDQKMNLDRVRPSCF
jgi:hypothetical protein